MANASDNRNRIANSIARAIVQLVDDSGEIQLLQIGLIAGEDRESVERFQNYGLTSVPPAGSPAVAIFPDGDRGHGLIITVDSSEFRLTGLASGEVAVYNDAGAKMIMKADGSIEANPAAGQKMYVRSEGGGSDEVVTKGTFVRHTHATAALGTPSVPIPFSGGPLTYTVKFEAE